MPKYFLYIDESKDFKNHTLYLGGLVSKLNIGMLEVFCAGCATHRGKGELKSTQDYDRRFFEEIISKSQMPFEVLVEKITAHSDREYLDNIIQYVSSFLVKYKKVDEIEIFADFTRLDPDTKRVEKAFSKKLSHHFNLKIHFLFKNSRTHRCIQFADLAVGSFRKQKKGPAFGVSQSESKTSLRTTARDL